MKRSLLLPGLFLSALFVTVSFSHASLLGSQPFVKRSHSHVINVSSDVTTSAGAEEFITNFVDQGIGLLENDTLSKSKQKFAFRALLNKNFDLNTIARFSLGRHWRSATKTQRDEYLRLFKRMIVDVYSNRFNEYQGQNIEVLGSRQEGERDILVQSKLWQVNGPDIKIDWRVRQRDGRYRIIDIIVEGVSMALTQRSDFSSVVQRGGGNIEALLVHLRAN